MDLLREKARELLAKGTSSTKYILLIDFKQAYDLVNHRLLLERLEKMGTPESVVKCTNKPLSYVSVMMDARGSIVWINNGQVQGAMLSPYLFNIYINDLIKLLEEAELCPITYADDLAVLCDGEGKLNQAMKIIHKWGVKKDIAVNKNKS